MRKRDSTVFVSSTNCVYLENKSNKQLQISKGKLSENVRTGIDNFVLELSFLLKKKCSLVDALECLALSHFGGVEGLLNYNKDWDQTRALRPLPLSLEEIHSSDFTSYKERVKKFQIDHSVNIELDPMNSSKSNHDFAGELS